jgi:hypothetical protein
MFGRQSIWEKSSKKWSLYFDQKIGPQSPKTEFDFQNQHGRVIYLSLENFTWSKKKYYFVAQNDGKSPQSPKTEFGPQISMIEWHINCSGILHGVRKNAHLGIKNVKAYFRAQKQNLGSKFVWLSDISIDREFYVE